MQKLIYRNPNGEEIDFTSGDFGVTKWSGFSKVDMDVQSQQVPFHDGSVFLDALLGERELSVTVAVNDDNNLEKRYRLKRELIHCLNPKLGEGELIYTNDYTSKKIVCVPDIPEFDNKNMNDSGTMKAMCSFTASNPYWEDVEETIVPFSLYDNINMNNEGDVPCPLSVELYGDGLLNPRLRNITTQKEVSLSGNYTGAISYNFQYGKKEIKFGALTQEVKVLAKYSDNYSSYNPSIAEGNGVIVISGRTSYYSYDGYNYNVIHNLAGAGSYDVSLASVYYSTQHSCFFATKITDGVYSSQDGKTWQKISNETVGWIISIGETLVGFTLDYPEIKKSVDGGVTWTVAYTGAENITSISASENLIIATTASNLYSSTDFGDTWTQSAGPGPYGGKIIWNSESEAFFLTDTGSGTFKSSDGTSWTQVMNDNIIALIFKPSDEKLYAILRQYGVYKLYSSSDMGDSWELVGNSFSANIVSWSNYAGRAICILENELRLSFDLINYEEKIFPSINDIAVAEDKKIILGDKYYYKDEEWHQIIATPSTSHNQCCCYGKGIFLIKYILNRSYLLRSSDDCNTWSLITIPTGMGTQRIAYSEGLSKFFCGQYSSTDGINWSKTTDANVYNIFAVDTPNGSWLYASKTSYGHYLKSTDGITWIDTNVTVYSDGGDVCYCAKQNLVYLIYYNDIYVNKPETDVYTKIDFFQNEGMLYLAWSDELNMFIGNGGTIEGGSIYKNWSYISYDGINWEHISSSTVSKYVYVKFLKSFIGTNGTSVKFVGEENIINNLNENSDMDFNLKIGNNQLRWSATTGSGMGTITYKQKYLGV